VERALALNPNLAAAMPRWDGLSNRSTFDWAGADASYRRAFVLDPGNPEVVRTAAGSAAMLGRFDEALQLNRRAVTWIRLMQTVGVPRRDRVFMGQLRTKPQRIAKKARTEPDVVASNMVLSQIYVMQGGPQDACLKSS